MKRRDLIRVIVDHADLNGLEIIVTEGSRHTKITCGTRRTVVFRHREINERTAAAILKQLGVTS